MADDIVTRLREGRGQGCTCAAYNWGECGCSGAVWAEAYTNDAADEIERLRAAGNALSDLVTRRLPHHGWTTADRDAASALLDAWNEARREQ